MEIDKIIAINKFEDEFLITVVEEQHLSEDMLCHNLSCA